MIHLIPCLKDNYSYVIEGEGGRALVVDPGDAAPVLRFLEQQQWRCVALLATHHHPDHIGGSAEIRRQYDCPVYGFEGDRRRIEIDRPLTDGQRVSIANRSFEILHIPGHTLGHIAFVMDEGQSVFCGDTLFSLGCGRLFEGTLEQMTHSLQKLSRLPPRCEVYCGHEYTLANLNFAMKLQPARYQVLEPVLRQRLALQGSTLPTTVGFENEWNPFLQAVQAPQPVATFAELRRRKDVHG